MNKDHLWRAISIDSILPDIFPDIALYIKSSGNYVLYKESQRKFSIEDRLRMERSQVDFVYVRSGDIAEVNSCLENNLNLILANSELGGFAKGKAIYQTAVNCVIDVFESPELAANQMRCQKLIGNLISYISNEPHCLDSLRLIADRNFYIFAHSIQVTALNLLMHEKIFNVSHEELVDVGIGSLVHDFGMTFISGDILDKPESLSSSEYHQVKTHTTKGYEFLKQSGAYSNLALTIVQHHHEHFNGNGYPAALKGNDIPRSAQLAAICDIYSALINDQPYRPASSSAEALRIMKQESTDENGVLNPELLHRFEKLIVDTTQVTNNERSHLLPRQ